MGDLGRSFKTHLPCAFVQQSKTSQHSKGTESEHFQKSSYAENMMGNIFSFFLLKWLSLVAGNKDIFVSVFYFPEYTTPSHK